MNEQIENAKSAVVRVGEGRGFIIQNGCDRLILTAAHCLPHFPTATAASHTTERTYVNLIGPIDAAEPAIYAEVLFADPVADTAALGMPDDQMLPEESEQYETFTEALTALRIAKAPERLTAYALDLDCRWFECRVVCIGPRLHIMEAEKPIIGGMSGSPVVDANGAAIGMVCLADGMEGSTKSEMNPRLASVLPGWLLQN